jgi:thymidylate synthase
MAYGIYKPFDIIVATDTNNGIAMNYSIPWFRDYEGIKGWSYKDDLKHFRQITMFNEYPSVKNNLIVGSITHKLIGNLADRITYVLSKSTGSFDELIIKLSTDDTKSNNFVIGGEMIYNLAVNHVLCRYVYITKILKDYKCDKFFTYPKHYKVINECKINDNVVFIKLLCKQHDEFQYLNLLKNVIEIGYDKKSRSGNVKSLFERTLTFDMTNHTFPLYTTKKVAVKSIFEELKFFLLGHTDTKELEKKGVTIWKGNTSKEFIASAGLQYPEGVMGPMYGYQLRHFGAEYDHEKIDHHESLGGLDQLATVLSEIKSNPESRRLIMTMFNPIDAPKGVLYPCHGIVIQFYVNLNKTIDMSCYIRSNDLFLGHPFNVSSYALFLIIVCNILGSYSPNKLHIIIGDAHIYENHFDAVKTQLTRLPYTLPTIKLNKKLETLNDIQTLEWSDFELINYISHDKITAKMNI